MQVFLNQCYGYIKNQNSILKNELQSKIKQLLANILSDIFHVFSKNSFSFPIHQYDVILTDLKYLWTSLFSKEILFFTGDIFDTLPIESKCFLKQFWGNEN